MPEKTFIKLKRGLLDPKHRQKIGPRIWLLLYMIDRADWETGKITDWRDKEAAKDLDMKLRTVRDQRQKLESDDYVSSVQSYQVQTITINNWIDPSERWEKSPEHGDNPMSPWGNNQMSPCAHGNNQMSPHGISSNVTIYHIKNILSDNNYYDFDTLKTFLFQATGDLTEYKVGALSQALSRWQDHQGKLDDQHKDKHYHPSAVIAQAIQKTGEAPRPSVRYMSAIVNRWIDGGINLNGHGGKTKTNAMREQLEREGIL
jgi:hypothetical protein